MKKLLLLLPLFLLFGCTNKVEENKNEYLSYKSELQEKEKLDEIENVDFNSYFNLTRDSEEKIAYSLVIEDVKINMYKVKALLIHDYFTEEVFPSVGIFDDPVTLLANTDNKIILKGEIVTEKDISNTKFKLYFEYEDEEGILNTIYYEVPRG